MTTKAYTAKAGMRGSTVVTYTYTVRKAEMGLAADAADTRYMAAYEDRTFKPDQAMTRAEFTAIANRIAGKKVKNAPPRFEDILPAHWAYEDIMSAYLRESKIMVKGHRKKVAFFFCILILNFFRQIITKT